MVRGGMLKGHRAKYQLLPHQNLPCLQIAQSLHHNRWDSCLSSLPPPCNTHTLSRVAATGHIHARTDARTHTPVPDSRHWQGGRTETFTVHIWSLSHIHTRTYVCTLTWPYLQHYAGSFFFSRLEFCVQGRRRPSARAAALSQQGRRKEKKKNLTPEIMSKKLPVKCSIVSIF